MRFFGSFPPAHSSTRPMRRPRLSSMIPFPTTSTQASRIERLALSMTAAGICSVLVSEAVALARTDQGIFDLLELWHEESDATERDETLRTLRQCLQDYGCRLP